MNKMEPKMEAGYLFLDVLTAIFILMIIGGAIAGIFQVAVIGENLVLHQDVATGLGQEAMEKIKAGLPVSPMETCQINQMEYSISVLKTECAMEYKWAMEDIEVTVAWSERGRKEKITLKTYRLTTINSFPEK